MVRSAPNMAAGCVVLYVVVCIQNNRLHTRTCIFPAEIPCTRASAAPSRTRAPRVKCHGAHARANVLVEPRHLLSMHEHLSRCMA